MYVITIRNPNKLCYRLVLLELYVLCYQVTRKVFVDLENSRKKDMKVPSSNVKVFIGSMRINSLGYVVPVSVVDGTKYILPVGYEAERLYWSSESPDSIQLYSMSTNLNTKGDFRPYLENLISTNQEAFHVVVNHSDRRNLKAQRKTMTEFFEWIRNAPLFVDEFKNEWQMPYIPSIMNKQKNGNDLMKNGFKKFFDSRVHD
jgi:hypothetical protein